MILSLPWPGFLRYIQGKLTFGFGLVLLLNLADAQLL